MSLSELSLESDISMGGLYFHSGSKNDLAPMIEGLNRGVQIKVFKGENADLFASQITAQLQQWHLKPWKFKLKNISLPQSVDYCFQNLLNGLDLPPG